MKTGSIIGITIGLALILTSFTPIVSSASSGYTFTFSEHGLPSGMSWTVTVSSSTYYQSYSSSSSTITFNNVPSYVEWSVKSSGMSASPSSSGGYQFYSSDQSFSISFQPTLYQTTFTNSVDSSGQYQWSVTLTGTEITGQSYSKTSTQYYGSATFDIPQGDYTYYLSDMNVSPPGGSGVVNYGEIEYVPSDPTGSFNGVPPATVYPTYNVYTGEITFSTSSLPSSATFTVSLNGNTLSNSGGDQINYYVDPGIYTYTYSDNAVGYSAVPNDPNSPSGSISVSSNSQNYISVTYTNYYNVYFNETGLPPGTTWIVNLSYNGGAYEENSLSGSNPSPLIDLQYGNYNFMIPNVGYYHAYPSSGSFTLESTLYYDISFSYVAPKLYPVTFTTSNLPVSTEFWVDINGENYTGNNTLTVNEPDGSYHYTYGAQGYYSGSGVLTVNNGSVQQTLNFVQQKLLYSITFSIEITTGTFSLQGDTIIFNGTIVTSGETLQVTQGAYSISSGTISSGQFSSWSTNGLLSVEDQKSDATIVNVNGNGGLVMNVAPSQVSTTYYTLTITSGNGGFVDYSYGTTTGTVTPGGEVELTLASGTSVSIKAIADSYYTFNGWSGTFQESTQSFLIGLYENTEERASFVQTVFAITFLESGLPPDSSWSVIFNNTEKVNQTGRIIFDVQSGTYSYSVSSAGYVATPASGSFQVNSNQTVQIKFSLAPPPTYKVQFDESGLSSGTLWEVTLNGVSQSSTGSDIEFSETQGSYEYSISVPQGYSVSKSSGTVSVSAPVKINVIFSQIYWYQNSAFSISNISVQMGESTVLGHTIVFNQQLAENPTIFSVITRSSGTTESEFAEALLQEFGIQSPQSFAPLVTIIMNLPLVSDLNAIGGDIPAKVMQGNFQDVLPSFLFDGNPYLETTPQGSLQIALTLSGTTNELQLATDVGSLIVKLATVVESYLSPISKSSSDAIINTFISAVNLITQSADTTVTDITTPLTHSGPLTSYTFFDLYTVGKVITSSIHVGTMFKTFLSVISFGAKFMENAIIAAGTAGIDVISDAAGIAAFVQMSFAAMSLAAQIFSYLFPQFNSNTLLSTVESGIEMIAGFVDPNGTSIAPTVYLNSNLSIGYDSENDSFVTETDGNYALYLGGSYFFFLNSTFTGNVSVKMNVIGGNSTVPYYLQELSSKYNYSNTVTGESFGGTSPIISSSISYGNVSINENYLIPKIILKEISGSASTNDYGGNVLMNVTVIPEFQNGTIANVSGVYINYNGGVMTLNKSGKGYYYINGEFQYGTTYDVYIDSHKYAGGFASFSTEGPMSETFREVTFRESGLPKALNWSLEIGGKIYSSSNSTISVFLGPGQYGYFAENESVFYTSNYSGIIDVNDSNISYNLTFYHYGYIFGNLNPANSTILINGKRVYTQDGSFNISLPAGVYNISIYVHGYQTFNRTVALKPGQAYELNATLKKITNPPITYDFYALIILLAFLGAVGFAYYRRR